MKTRLLALGALVLIGALVPGCSCSQSTQSVKPALAISPSQLSFGPVKVGKSADLPIKLKAQSNTAVSITRISVRDGSTPEAASFFEVVAPPELVGSLSEVSFVLRFKPNAIRAYEAILVVESNDAKNPSIEILVDGEGADPVLNVIPDCSPTRKCKGTVSVTPPAIDYGAEPFMRAVEIPTTQLPSVTMVNEGQVELTVTGLSIAGADAAAFTFVGISTLPDHTPDGKPALFLGPGEGQGIPVRFKPTSEMKTDYQAEVVITSDDPAHAEVRVKLSGKLGANLPPVVCANINSVAHFQDVTDSYDTKAIWDGLLTPPVGGYDFSDSREIRPRSTVRFSANSSSDASTCTSDPEDLRQGLTYGWALTERPAGAEGLTFGSANTATPVLIPVATGAYTVTLSVSDSGGHTTVVPIHFKVARREDLVVQLSWNGNNKAYSGVDLDLHLVRPAAAAGSSDPFSGAFDWFNLPDKTSGDISGYSNTLYAQNQSEGFNFDWGLAGTGDDPRQNLDDVGNGDLLENVSMNFPENDPACATSSCTYKVFVHYFGDGRNNTNPTSCSLSGCKDGEACNCGPGLRCVADNAQAQAATGAGKCYAAPEPVVRVFVKGGATPLATIPLPTASAMVVPAPCMMLYVADVVWPAKNAAPGTPPQVIAKSGNDLARFGERASGFIQKCTPNSDPDGDGTVDWYGRVNPY